IAVLTTAAAAFAQGWEAGAAAGFGANRHSAVTGPAGSARAGFAVAPAFGVYVSQDVSSRLGGEIRYTYSAGDLSLRSGETKVTFGGESHLAHYDLLVYAAPQGANIRPFFALGAGARLTRGTGQESAYQPLMQHALLTRTRQVQAIASLGAGLKMKVGERMMFRAEFRDYVSAFPMKVIAPAGGAKINGWLHDIVPLVGLGWIF
ncbi:MAG TPA: outer membrane beta-barrel protein, partial [Bryobacteraceae bacterium]|nr:outer membrane beta-barrel protein [Bryobacteraceae bacterium]